MRSTPTSEKDVIAVVMAAAELPMLRAIASADIHNLVFETGGDYGIIPATLNRQPL
jgi:hypothetical protein